MKEDVSCGLAAARDSGPATVDDQRLPGNLTAQTDVRSRDRVGAIEAPGG